ncbi:MAG: replication-associated recombination protein A [marine bacterium B5-7]|nr:MAG: replication-associated recombination protein A [marine bacterium B5-7]
MSDDQRPLADAMRPRTLAEFVGQQHLLAPGRSLNAMIANKHLQSMILWGPPGTGKTTLARILTGETGLAFDSLSAVTDGVREVRAVVERARQRQDSTVLFVDEVHRFNKSQQDAFLPHLESGLLILIGATTENPSFALNNALLSRASVHVLKSLSDVDLMAIVQSALEDPERGLGSLSICIDDNASEALIKAADGDGRRVLNLLESAVMLAETKSGELHLDVALISEAASVSVRRFDKGGDVFYDLTSALHKSIRGSDPNAALYWMARLVDGGCDPAYIARRLIRIASEDIGNADPRALTLALDADEAFRRLGSPEGELALAQATVYLAVAAKSNAVYRAFSDASADTKRFGSAEVPDHLRNAPTRLAEKMGHGKGYRYAHDEEEGYAAGEHYFPDNIPQRHYYQPVDRGMETKIREKLAHLRRLDSQTTTRRRS